MDIVLKIGSYLVAGIVVVLGLLLVGVQTSLIPNTELLIVRSGSMEPAISTGSLVLISATERYEVGDVITFRLRADEALPTTHRIVSDNLAEGQLVYTTKGDANATEDQESVPHDRVLGKVLFGVPFLGYVLDFAGQPVGFLLLIVLPAFLIMVESISSIWQEIRAGKQQATTEEHI